MFSKIKEFCLLFCLFNQVSRNYGSLKSPTLLEDLLLKEIIHSIDIASDNENLFEIILKLLNSVCACVQQTLNEKQNSIFNVETNILREDEDNTVSNIELYKKIYNRTCINLKKKVMKKIYENNNIADINGYKLNKRLFYVDKITKENMEHTLFEILVKNYKNRKYRIRNLDSYKNKILMTNKNEYNVVIIITLFPNSIEDLNNYKNLSEYQLVNAFTSQSPVDIDIIRTTSFQNSDNTPKFDNVKTCHLYSIYNFLSECIKNDTVKMFKFIKIEKSLKIYINTIAYENFDIYMNKCCSNEFVWESVMFKNIFKSAQSKLVSFTEKYNKKLDENYQIIINNIKMLIYQYAKKISYTKNINSLEKRSLDDIIKYQSNNCEVYKSINYSTTSYGDVEESNIKVRKYSTDKNNLTTEPFVFTESTSIPSIQTNYLQTESNYYKRIPSESVRNISIDTIMLQDLTTGLPNTIRQQSTVTDWWLDDMYLKIRSPLPINSNPGMVFPRRQFAKIDEVADLAALYIDDLLDYKEMLDRGELPQERATSREKGQPLCMEQFYRLLGVCRIPEVGKDRLELPPRPSDPNECEELVIVACRNYFYPIPVKAADRGRLTPGEIQAQILHAMVDAAGAAPAQRVGLLTTLNRDQWAKAREQLIKDENNRANLDLISRALCIMCVDEEGGDRSELDADSNALLRAMHGGGTRYHTANRWFDKTVQLIISSDGTTGMCYEHSPAEGVAVVRLAERALARAEVAPPPAPPPALLPAPLPLKWRLSAELARTVEVAAKEVDRSISDLDLKVYTYRGYGREFMKSCRTSPDVYIQLALQYAYFKLYGYLVCTYESASLRRFRNGRVDNIRSAHSAARAWAAAMCADDTTTTTTTTGQADDGQKKVSFNLYGEQKKLELFEEAARKQTAIMEANILGRGIDNHLLGLREAAREALGDLPEVFKDTTYNRMIEFKLSTSQVATTADGTFMGYGAVVPDGYGCSYNPKKDCIIFCISSFISSSVTNTEAFRQSLEEALDSMKLMFQNRKVES